MRQRFGLVLAGLLLALGWAILQPQLAPLSATEDYSQQMMHSHRNDRPIPTAAVAQAPTVPVTTEQVTYGTVNGTSLRGFLARPTNMAEPLPALIVIHEWWGLNDNIQAMTQRLAGEGYTALAVDLYNGQVAQDPDKAKELVQTAMQNPHLLEQNLMQAYQYLTTEQKAPKIGSIGWCFGGMWSINTGLLLGDRLNALVVYYGGQLPTDADRLKALTMPILGIFGALDQNPSVERVRAFEASLKSLGKTPEIYIYDNANHAFANPSGRNYNAQAAEDAWKHTVTFLKEHLKAA